MIASPELIGRIEHFEASRVEQSALIFKGDVLRLGKGVASYCGEGNVATQAVGFGVGEGVSKEVFEQIVAHYRGRCSKFEFKLSVIAPHDLREWVVRRAVSLPEFETLLVRSLEEWMPPKFDLDIRLVGPAEARAYAQRSSRWFFPGESPPGLIELIEMVCVGESTRTYEVYRDGAPIAGCSLGFQDGVASLGGAAVAPEYRGQGLHKAMQAYRMAVAQSLGCTIVMQGALAGSISQQNAQKNGFQISFTRPTFMVDPNP